MKRVPLLYRKMLSELSLIHLVCVGVFISLIVLGRLLQLGKILVSLNLTILDVGKLMFFLCPFFLFVLLPVGCMLSLFLTFQRMSTDRELIALRSSGISLGNILPPAIFFLLVMTALNFWFSFSGISWGMDRFYQHLISLARTRARLSLKPGVFSSEFKDLTVYLQRVEQKKGQVYNLFIENRRLGKSVVVIGPKGFLSWDPRKKTLYFSVLNGKIYYLDKKAPSVVSFGEYDMKLDLMHAFKHLHVASDEPKFMSWKELNVQLHKNVRKGGKFYTELIEEWHKRIAIPLSCLVLGLFAIPLGWMLEGMKRFYGALLMIGMFLLYYVIFALGRSLVEGGVLCPWIGIWAPNIVFSILTVVAFYMASGEKIRFFVRH